MGRAIDTVITQMAYNDDRRWGERMGRAEDIAASISGVTHEQNNLRVKPHSDGAVQGTMDSFANAASGVFGERGGSTNDTTKTTTGSSPGPMKPGTSSTSRGS